MFTHNLAMDSYQIPNQMSTSYYKNYYESSDSSSSPVMNQNHFPMNSYGFSEDMDVSDERINDSVLSNHNLNTQFTRAPVNRGGRKQVKVGTTKRNARERNRVRYINNCFEVLREHIPIDMYETDKNQKLSKVETLKYATIYIQRLAELLEADDNNNMRNGNKMDIKKEASVPTVQNKSTKNADENKEPPKGTYNVNRASTVSYNNININVYNSNGSVSPTYSSTSPCSTGSSSSLSDHNSRYFSQELSPSAYNTQLNPGYLNGNCGKAATLFDQQQQQSNVYGSYEGFYNHRW